MQPELDLYRVPSSVIAQDIAEMHPMTEEQKEKLLSRPGKTPLFQHYQTVNEILAQMNYAPVDHFMFIFQKPDGSGDMSGRQLLTHAGIRMPYQSAKAEVADPKGGLASALSQYNRMLHSGALEGRRTLVYPDEGVFLKLEDMVRELNHKPVQHGYVYLTAEKALKTMHE